MKLTYEQNLKENLWNFIVSRLFPFFGISIAAALLAHKNIADLPVFAYVLAIFSVISTLFYMPLAAIGNIVHHQKNALTPQAIFESGLSIAVLFAAIAFAAALTSPPSVFWTALTGINFFTCLLFIFRPSLCW